MRNEKVKQVKKIIPGLTVMAQKKDLHRNKYGLAWRYNFSIATNKGRYAAIFTDSINNHNNNIPVNLDDILSLKKLGGYYAKWFTRRWWR